MNAALLRGVNAFAIAASIVLIGTSAGMACWNMVEGDYGMVAFQAAIFAVNVWLLKVNLRVRKGLL
jgi:hypothetical protein